MDHAGPVGSTRGLGGTSQPLCDAYDLAILDLDGTVYVGRDVVPGAASAIAALAATSMRVAFVTNNASRTPDRVAATLRRMGIEATPQDVVTSAQAAAASLVDKVPAGAAVLVVGGEGLVVALQEVGLQPVSTLAEGPLAVVQGWAPDLGWRLLAEGAYALQAGLPWVATNTDLTVPTPSGLAPGNGSFVALLAAVVGRQPDLVAGKPGATLLAQTAERFGATKPLVVGDRLDTDVEGAAAAGMDSLLVLTGVSGVADLLAAPPQQRPTYVGTGLAGLLQVQPQVIASDGGYRVRDCAVAPVGPGSTGTRTLDLAGPAGPASADPLDTLRAAAAACWRHLDDGDPLVPTARLQQVLDRLSP